jgi:hypothetical protein
MEERNIGEKTDMLIVLKGMSMHAPSLSEALDRRIDEDILKRLAREKSGALDVMKIGEKLKVRCGPAT